MSDTLRIFVAMPGTSMGKAAAFTDPEGVKRNLLTPIQKELKSRLKRKVEMVIEKDKKQAGPIHSSMFKEAHEAEVYIADLTGANPNVYLELGVRWAVRDCVTILIYQNESDLRFNVAASRAILYNPNNLMTAVEKIVDAIVNGLDSREVDSPVRQNAQLLTIPATEIAQHKKELEARDAEIARLIAAQGADLIKAAKASSDLDDRIRLLEQALATNPSSTEALLELGMAYRDGSNYEKAAETLLRAVSLDADNPRFNRELGLAYSKLKKIDPAIQYLTEATRLNPQDSEAWSNLGGAYRRKAAAGAPGQYDETSLRSALDSYQKAHAILEYDLYSGFNIARITLLLSLFEPTLYEKAIEEYDSKTHLTFFEIKNLQKKLEKENDAGKAIKMKEDIMWRTFDLGEALLFTGKFEEARTQFQSAIKMIPEGKTTDILSSVKGPFQNYLETNLFKGSLLHNIKELVSLLTSTHPKPGA